MEKRRILCLGVCGVSFLLAACVPTPKESAVVSTKGGLSEEIMDKPLPSGTLRKLDIPSHLSDTLRRGKNENVLITIDLDVEVPQVGNLPVVEMKKTTASEVEKQKLDSFFSGLDVKDAVWEYSESKNAYYYNAAYVTNEEMLQNLLYMSVDGWKTSKGDDVKPYIDQMKNVMEEAGGLSVEGAKNIGDQIIKDIGVFQDFTLLSTQKAITFGTGKSVSMQTMPDIYLEARELDKGIELCYTKSVVKGFPLDYAFDQNGVYENQSEIYTPPFPVEKIVMTVTDKGVAEFQWESPAQVVGNVADNTKLMKWDEIFERLADNLYYSNIDDISPTETAVYEHNVIGAKLGYCYIPAYQNPKNVWAVPTWFFDVSYHISDTAHPEIQIDRPVQKVMISALDGRYISDSVAH